MEETALERLSKIKDIETFNEWCDSPFKYIDLVSDIQEVVALAKQPSIDAMRFEAAKAAMQGILAGIVRNDKFNISDILENSVYYGDALVSKLQKTKP